MLTRSLTQPLTGPLVRGVGEGGGNSLPFVSYLKVATFGDSTADVKNLATSGNLDQSVADAQTNGTVISRTFPTSRWLLSRYYPAAQLETNGGIAGQSTQAMLDRSGLASSASRKSIEDVLAASPGLIIARCGSVNDIATFTTATTQASIDGVFNRHMQIINALAAGGAYVLDEGIAGYDASGGVAPAAPDLAFIRAALIGLNQRIAAAIAALGNRKVRFLDPVGVTCDATGAFLPNVTASSDGTHLTDYGQDQLARAEKAILPGWIGPSAATPFTGTNLLASLASFTSTSVVSYGTVPNSTDLGWGPGNGTRQNARIESIGGVNFAVCELLGTGASPTLTFFTNLVPLLVTPALVAAGDIVTFELDFYMDALVGTLAANPFSARVQLGVSSSDRIIYDMTSALFTPSAALNSLSGRLSFGKIKMPTSLATLTTGSTLFFINMIGATGSTCRLKVGNLRIVKQ